MHHLQTLTHARPLFCVVMGSEHCDVIVFIPSVGPAGLHPFFLIDVIPSKQLLYLYFILSTQLLSCMRGAEYRLLQLGKYIFSSRPPTNLSAFTILLLRPPHSEKQKADVTSAIFRLLFTVGPRLGSQDSQDTRVATNRRAACKHWPGLTCVYPTTLRRVAAASAPASAAYADVNSDRADVG